MKPWIVMRAHNDMPVIGETLRELARQTCPFELVVLDNESSDGTLDEVRKYTDRVVNITNYIPGRVLNTGMENSEGEVVVFLNADCTAQDEFWLERLVSVFDDEKVGAAFSRQIPRPDCMPIFAKDTEDTYGDGRRQSKWRHCFSMAASAIRRSAWTDMPFNNDLKISEDIDWTWRARQRGYTVRYVPDSVVMHSHNYTLRQHYTRQYKEGWDEAHIFDLTPWECSLLRYSILPCGRQILSDWRCFLSRMELGEFICSPVWRVAQTIARRSGLKAGLDDRSGRGPRVREKP